MAGKDVKQRMVYWWGNVSQHKHTKTQKNTWALHHRQCLQKPKVIWRTSSCWDHFSIASLKGQYKRQKHGPAGVYKGSSKFQIWNPAISAAMGVAKCHGQWRKDQEIVQLGRCIAHTHTHRSQSPKNPKTLAQTIARRRSCGTADSCRLSCSGPDQQRKQTKQIDAANGDDLPGAAVQLVSQKAVPNLWNSRRPVLEEEQLWTPPRSNAARISNCCSQLVAKNPRNSPKWSGRSPPKIYLVIF